MVARTWNTQGDYEVLWFYFSQLSLSFPFSVHRNPFLPTIFNEFSRAKMKDDFDINQKPRDTGNRDLRIIYRNIF